jgi:hypothetical protein
VAVEFEVHIPLSGVLDVSVFSSRRGYLVLEGGERVRCPMLRNRLSRYSFMSAWSGSGISFKKPVRALELAVMTRSLGLTSCSVVVKTLSIWMTRDFPLLIKSRGYDCL